MALFLHFDRHTGFVLDGLDRRLAMPETDLEEPVTSR